MHLPANPHGGSSRRNNAVSEDPIRGTLGDVLDVIVQSNIGEHQFEQMSHKPATRTAILLADLLITEGASPSTSVGSIPRMFPIAKSQIDFARCGQGLIFAVHGSLVGQGLVFNFGDILFPLWDKTERVVFIRVGIKTIIVVHADGTGGHPCALGKMMSARQGDPIPGHDFAEHYS